MIRKYHRYNRSVVILILSTTVFGLMTVVNTNIRGGITPPIGTHSEVHDDQPIGKFILWSGNFATPTPNICLGINEADQIQGTLGSNFIYAKNGPNS
jgi:hypothetical protein